MELGDWEYLSESNLISSEIVEDNSNLVHGEDQQQVVVAQVGLVSSTEHDESDVSVKEIREITEECVAVPQIQLESGMNDNEIEESKEVEFEGKEVLKEEKSETDISRSFEFVEEEEEVEEVKEVTGGMEPSGSDCVNGSDQRNLRWRLRGLGALSSVGIAAATLSMLILGGCKRSQMNMEIYAENKVSVISLLQFLVSSVCCKISKLCIFL